jgi:hypothetical protein
MLRVFSVFLSVCLLLCSARSFAERSALYPADWSPGFHDGAGRFLHDFSYAGYQNGKNLPDPATISPRFDVVAEFGADNQGRSDATAAIQAAIDACRSAGGGLVYLPAGIYRCEGSLAVLASNIVLCGESASNTYVYFTQRHSTSSHAHLIFGGSVKQRDSTPLAEDGEALSFDIRVTDSSAFSVGDDVTVGWTITDEFVAEHGMTGTWQAFNGEWQPFFQRTITAIDSDSNPPVITLDVPLRYPAKLRDGAVLTRNPGYLSGCGVMNLAVSDAIERDLAWSQRQTQIIQMTDVKDSYIYRIRSFQSPACVDPLEKHVQSGGIRINNSKRVTVAYCQMENSQNRGDGGNGYLYEVRQSNEILYQDCVARKGRHNFVQNWGFGATGIVWLRCESMDSAQTYLVLGEEVRLRAFSEYHHSLSMACLVDSCFFNDGWSAGNRRHYSTGGGHSATQCALWNTRGLDKAEIRSYNFGHGYVIGTKDIAVKTLGHEVTGGLTTGTEPWDYKELIDAADLLEPQSLYESQRNRRLGFDEQVLSVSPARDGIVQVPEGDAAELRLLVSHGRGTLRYQWYRVSGDGIHEALTGETGDSLSFSLASEQDTGGYFCEVRDDFYTRTSPVIHLVVTENKSVSAGSPGVWISGVLAVVCFFIVMMREKSASLPA